jgi:hypothetical protein
MCQEDIGTIWHSSFLKDLLLIRCSVTRKTIMCNFPRRCILLDGGATPSNGPGFGDNDSRNCRVKGHLWRPELLHLQREYESFRRGSFTLRCAFFFFQKRDFSFVGWRIIFTPTDKWLNRKVLKREEKTKFPIGPGPSCDKTEFLWSDRRLCWKSRVSRTESTRMSI